MICGNLATMSPVARLSLEEAFSQLLQLFDNPEAISRIVLSGRRRNMQVATERIDIRPVLIKEKLYFQVSTSDGRAVRTKKYPPSELPINEYIRSGYANILVEGIAENFSLRITKKDEPLISITSGVGAVDLAHDKKKERLLDPADPFLREVGISDASGQIKPSRSDKYRQVEEFLRLLAPTLNSAIEAGHIVKPTTSDPLTIVDLGCGHAYLTFAAYRYFQLNGRKVKFVGVDIRESSRVRNQEIAQKFGIADDVTFIANEISDFDGEKFDVAIALHACDTATDDALAWAINNEVEIILAAPCCHYDLHRQVKRFPKDVEILAYDGILANRQLDLITDELRAQILRLMGYKTDVFEFISGDHTARNLMIRAIWSKEPGRDKKLSEYRHICQTWGIAPALEARLKLGAIPASD